MSLIRCSQLLSRKNGNFLNLFKQSTVHYSDEKKSAEDEAPVVTEKLNKKDEQKSSKPAKKAAKTPQISEENQNRLNDLLKKLTTRSALQTIKEVQTAKPKGYHKIRETQKLDAKEIKPRNVTDAATAVSKELGDEKIKSEILEPLGTDQGAGFLDDVISNMKTIAKRKDPLTGTFKDGKINRDSYTRRRSPVNPQGGFKRDTNNYFEKMAYWTEEGKIWHFPIDNEQGLDEEIQTSFTEHIFLEEHIESWCPKRGAVRNFMELICIGLSKNPYLTVKQKHEHLEWYRNYFEEKRDILQRVIEQSASNVDQIDDGKAST